MVITVPALEKMDGLIVQTDAPPFRWMVADPEPPQPRRYHPLPSESRHTFPPRFDRPGRGRLHGQGAFTILVRPVVRRGVIGWPDTMTLRQSPTRCQDWHAARNAYKKANDWKLGAAR